MTAHAPDEVDEFLNGPQEVETRASSTCMASSIQQSDQQAEYQQVDFTVQPRLKYPTTNEGWELLDTALKECYLVEGLAVFFANNLHLPDLLFTEFHRITYDVMKGLQGIKEKCRQTHMSGVVGESTSAIKPEFTIDDATTHYTHIF